jgi:hypothetical protein
MQTLLLIYRKQEPRHPELEYLLLLCRDLDFLPSEAHQQLSEDVVTVRKMMSGLLKHL